VDVFPFVALLLSLPVAVAAVLTPRVPKRVVVPMILFVWWGGPCLAFPLVLVDASGALLWLSCAQVVMALAVLVSFHSPGSPWNQPFALRDGPFFRWRYSLLTGAAATAVVALFLFLSLVSNVAIGIAGVTGGYMRLRPDGLYLVERQFQSGDREVLLAGMMHVARQEFYSEILSGTAPGKSSVVLVEGVTDHKRLLGKEKLSYSRFARALGIASQERSTFSDQVREGLGRETGTAVNTTDFRYADVDIETFHPETVAFILAAFRLVEAEDWWHAIRMMRDPASPLTDEKATAAAMDDILHSRNKQLESQIETSLKDYQRVFVPWGAMHLPEIESWLRQRHFQQSGQVERKALGFW